MARHKVNPRLIKIHYPYRVEEAARRLKVHKNTVHNWLGEGLEAIDGPGRTLILGSVLRAFLEARRAKVKRPCPPGHFYCVRCRAPKRPAGGMADYIRHTETTGNLEGICPTCEGLINRRTSVAELGALQRNLDIKFPVGNPRLSKPA